MLSSPNLSWTSSDDASKPITAVEELQGQFNDCYSLLPSHFADADVSKRCVQPLVEVVDEAGTPSLRCDVSVDVVVPRLPDGRTVGTILFVLPKKDSSAQLYCHGVVVLFSYSRGFTCAARRLYRTPEEAAADANRLRSTPSAFVELLSSSSAWHFTRVAEREYFESATGLIFESYL